MATFYKGFVYETSVSGKPMIEGIVPPKAKKLRDAKALDTFAQRYINEVLLPRRDWIRDEHLAILNKGLPAWNRWRRMHPDVRPILAFAKKKDFTCKNLQGCDFSYTNLCQAHLPPHIHLERASFHQAILARANFSKAHLEGANFCRTDLYETNLTSAWLTGANLQGVQLAKTKLKDARLRGCTVYGLSAWDLRDIPKNQDQLRIRYTPAIEQYSASKARKLKATEEKEVEVDGLDLASFIYLTLNNRNISRIIDATSQKWVLILGRFTIGKEILKAIESVLERDYIPIIFDFPPPKRKDLIETLLVMGGLCAFVVVEMTNPRSTPLEVQAIVPNFGVPVLPIIKGKATVPAMISGLRKFNWVQESIRYKGKKDLIRKLGTWVKNHRSVKKSK
jgi:hypothetical protein